MAAGDFAYWGDLGKAPTPICRLVQQSAQSIAFTTDTALTFGSGSENIKSHASMHSTSSNTSRIVIPDGYDGIYDIDGVAMMVAPAGEQFLDLAVVIAANGTVQPPRVKSRGTEVNTATTSIGISTSLALAAGDYVELMVNQRRSAGSGSANTNVGGSFASVFIVKYRRPPVT